jgi:hypothetical protein
MLFQFAVLAASVIAPRQNDAEEILRRVVENQAANQEIQRQYTYTEMVATQFLRKDGSIRNAKSETFQVMPAPGGEYRKLVGKNGRSLSEKDQAKEEKKFKEYIEKQLELPPEEIAQRNENLSRRVGRFETRIREALEVFAFEALPDESFGGTRVRTFRFTPKPGYEPKSRATKLLHRTEGTLWVDPEKNQIVKLHIRFREDMKFLGGLFGRISKGTEAVAEQRSVGDEIWVLDKIDVLLRGRFYFVKRYNRRLKFDYSDYRKYTVSTKEVIASEPLKDPQ